MDSKNYVHMRTPCLYWFLILLFFASLASAADVTTFVYPDNVDVVDTFVSNSRQLLIATYTYDDPGLASRFPDGGNVTLLVEKSPVGGLQNRWLLCSLQRSGVTVALYDGELRYMHAKYMVNDGAVLVSTENVGSGNRGWAVVVRDAAIVEQFTRTFEEDLSDSIPLDCNGEETATITRKDYLSHFEPQSFSGQHVEAMFVPGAEQTILDLIISARERIYIQQFYIYKEWGGTTNPFLDALIEKARDGVDVKVLLDSTYYNRDTNGEVIAYLNEIATHERLAMEARYINPTYFDKSHAKGIIVDDAVLVSSINWNANSVRNNREAGVIVRGGASDYYARTFLADWENNYPTITGGATASWLSIVAAIVVFLIIVIALVVLWKRKRPEL